MPFLTLETLLVTEKATLSFERAEGGKIRVKATSWDGAKTILPDQVLEVRSIDGRLRFARKEREPDQGDQPKKAFDPEEFYGSDCKSRSNNPSLKRPIGSAAPESNCGS